MGKDERGERRQDTEPCRAGEEPSKGREGKQNIKEKKEREVRRREED